MNWTELKCKSISALFPMPGGMVLFSEMPKGTMAEPQEYMPGYKRANSKGEPQIHWDGICEPPDIDTTC